MPPAPDESISVCPGCGGKNPGGSTECDWCGRPFLSKGGRLRLTLWQVLSSLMLLGLIGAVAALAILSNAGRVLPPVRVGVGTSTPQPTAVPTLTPRVTAANLPTPEPTPTPQMQGARIFNTSGLGAWVHDQPGQQARRTRVLSEGTRVLLTGNDQTVAARPWREIETEDHNLKGWVQGDFLQLQQAAP